MFLGHAILISGGEGVDSLTQITLHNYHPMIPQRRPYWCYFGGEVLPFLVPTETKRVKEMWYLFNFDHIVSVGLIIKLMCLEFWRQR